MIVLKEVHLVLFYILSYYINGKWILKVLDITRIQKREYLLQKMGKFFNNLKDKYFYKLVED